MKRKSSQKEKSRRAPAQAKTPALRLNGNELAALKQISVLIASALVFLNACSDESPARFQHRLLFGLFASLRWQRRFSFRARFQHRPFFWECAALFLFFFSINSNKFLQFKSI